MKKLFFLFVLFPSVLLAQHTIKGVFSPANNYNVALLYRVTPTLSEYVTNTKFKPDGSFEFKLDSTAKKGVYRLVYAIPQEDYNFDIIYSTKEDIQLTFNSETGVKFEKSFENKLLESYTSSMSKVTQSIANYYRSQSKDTLALQAIFKTQKETQANFESLAKETIALDFIKANKPYTPESVLDIRTYISELKAHYFDAIDFSNPTLQSSNFLTEKMLNYVFGMSDKSLDEETNYKNNIDVVYAEMGDAPNEVKRILLLDLWQQMVDLKQETVANYIAEKYLIDIARSLNDQELVEALVLHDNLSNGKKAPDFYLETEEGKTAETKKLSDLDIADFYVIVFWSSGCSHCLDEIPQLQTFINTKETARIKVVAIGLENDPQSWKPLTEKYNEFIHVYGKNKWKNEIGSSYGVKSTPSYFILNKSKEFIAKPDNIEDVKTFFKDK